MKRVFAVLLQCTFFSMVGFGAEFVDRHYFIENKGQLAHYDGTPADEVLFHGRSEGVSYFLRNNGVSFVFEKVAAIASAADTLETHLMSSHRIDMNWQGSHPNPVINALGTAKVKFNYNLAHCPRGIHGVRAYKRLVYKEFYQGIDLVFYINESGVKYDFELRQGADPSQIQMNIEGADVFTNESGGLTIKSALGELTEEAPVSFETFSDGSVKPVSSHFEVNGNTVKYSIGTYNSENRLTIDPNRKWCLFFGSSGGDSPAAVEADNDGFIYVSGVTNGTNFPKTVGAFQDTLNGTNSDVFLCKIDSSGTSMIWATYFGGTGRDYSEKLRLHGDTMLYLSAVPGNYTYPAFGKVHSTNMDPGRSIALTRFDTSGRAYWSTFLGGGFAFSGFDYDVLKEIKTDESGHLYAYGYTNAPNFPTTTGAYQETIEKDRDDCFLTKFNLKGQLIWSTFIGSDKYDEAIAMITYGGNRVIVSAEFEGYNKEIRPDNTRRKTPVVAHFDTSGQLIDSRIFGTDVYLAGNQDHFYVTGVFDKDTLLPTVVFTKRQKTFMAGMIELDTSWKMVREIKVEESDYEFDFGVAELHFNRGEVFFSGGINPVFAHYSPGAFAHVGLLNSTDSNSSGGKPVIGQINQQDTLIYLSSLAKYDTRYDWHMHEDVAFNTANDIFIIDSQDDTLYATYEHGGITHRIGTIVNANTVVVKFEQQDFDIGVRRQKPLCHGNANASLKVEYDNNTSPLKIKWSTGDTTWLMDSLLPGWYEFVVSNGQGQFHSERVYVDSTELLQIGVEYDSLFCVERKGWLNLTSLTGAKYPVNQYRPYRYVYKGDTLVYAGGSYSMQPDFGTSTLYVIDIDGCKDSAVLDIDTFPIPKHSHSLKHVSCDKEEDGEIELSLSDTFLFDGIFLDYRSGSSFISYGKDLLYTKMIPRTYRYIVKYGGNLRCETGDTFKLEYRSDTLFNINASPALEVCNGDTVLLHVANDIPKFKWNNGSTLDTLYITKSDTIYALGSTKNGCEFRSDTLIIAVHRSDFNLRFTADPKELNKPPYTVSFDNKTQNPDRYSFNWQFGDGATSISPSPQHNYLNSGKYTVGLYAVDDTTGCKDSLVKKNLIEVTLTDGLGEPAGRQPIVYMKDEKLVVDINDWTSSEVELTLFDISGRKIINVNSSLDKIILDLSRYSSIAFVVELQNEKLVYREKILK